MKILKRVGFWLFILSLIYAIWPVLSVLAASGIATIGGCSVNEGFAQACPILGIDFGGLLYTMFVSGWYLFITVPIGAIGALVGLVLYIIAKISLHRRAKNTTPAV